MIPDVDSVDERVMRLIYDLDFVEEIMLYKCCLSILSISYKLMVPRVFLACMYVTSLFLKLNSLACCEV